MGFAAPPGLGAKMAEGVQSVRPQDDCLLINGVFGTGRLAALAGEDAQEGIAVGP